MTTSDNPLRTTAIDILQAAIAREPYAEIDINGLTPAESVAVLLFMVAMRKWVLVPYAHTVWS